MKRFDPGRRQSQRVHGLRITLSQCSVNFRLGKTQCIRSQVLAIKLRRQIDNRGIATRLHILDDCGNGRVDIFRHFALRGEKDLEGRFEIGIARVQPIGHGFSFQGLLLGRVWAR